MDFGVYDVSITSKEASDMSNLQKWAEQYLLACKYQKGLDAKTIKAYRIDLSQFILFMGSEEVNLTRASITEYMADLHQKFKPRTIRRKIASVKAFCGYLEYEELIAENPFAKLQMKLHAPLILPRTIPFSVIEAILSTAYQQGQRESLSEKQQKALLRDIAVLELLFATGMRVSELCSLKSSDVNLVEGEVKIYGKGAKERLVQIGNMAVLSALQANQELNYLAIEHTGMFFVNRLGKPLSDQSVRNIVAKYTRLAGEELHVTPHMFRHSFATLLLEEDVDIRYIQRLLGHSSIVTTQIYTYVSGRKQRDILSTKHPRNRIQV